MRLGFVILAFVMTGCGTSKYLMKNCDYLNSAEKDQFFLCEKP